VTGNARRLGLALLAAALLAVLPIGGAAAASPTLRMSIIHYVSGCHVWGIGAKILGPTAKVTVKPGTQLVIRPTCPMDFDFVQTAGPKLVLGDPRTYRGTARTIVFRKPGLYRLTAKNVQTSQEVGLQTLGPDNTLTLTIVVR
jgi:hypothetical protein